MGDFGKTVFCLVDFSETLLAHGVMKISIAVKRILLRKMMTHLCSR